jgi:hypothetical protein
MAGKIGDHDYCSLRSLSRWNVGISLQLSREERRERGSDFDATVQFDGRCGPRMLAHMVRVSESTFGRICTRDMDPGSRFTESHKADVKLHCTTSSLYHIANALDAQNTTG